MLRPLSERAATLSTTLSLSSPRWLDAIHLHFSHHVEHHLFPTLSHRYYPLVRASLRRRAGTRYFAPTHWGALRVLYATPRHYAENNVLVNPLTGTRVAMAEVEARLRRADPLCLGTPTDHRRS
jgi:fatty acid desaturase